MLMTALSWYWQARQIESELEAKTSAFAKLCLGYDGVYTGRGESGLAAEQVRASLHELQLAVNTYSQ